MNYVLLIGFAAGLLNTFCYLPQVIKIWKTKQTRDLSLPMYFALTTGTILWFLYGLLLNQAPIYLANGVALALTSSILYLKIKHG